jgi:hypothetical protein
MTRQCPNEKQEKPEQFYRPDEADRLRRAKEWLAVARGQALESKQ